MLADSAQVQGGKIYVLGGGWNVTGPQAVPSALTGLVRVEWSEANQDHTLRFDLVSDDGAPFMAPTPSGPQPFHVEMTFQVGRPPGIAPGSELNVPFAINIGPLPLEPGRRYEWRPAIDGVDYADDRLAFSMRQAPPGQQIGDS
jgi:Family of unknown function (DUF6941)